MEPYKAPFHVESYHSNHGRMGAQVWYKILDATGRTVDKGFRNSYAAQRRADALNAGAR